MVQNGDRSGKEFDGHGDNGYNEDGGDGDIVILDADEEEEEDQDEDLDMELFGDG